MSGVYIMQDYHTHVPGTHGGYLCSVTRADWERVARAEGMEPCFGVHPWYVEGEDPTVIAFELDEWLSRYPKAGVGETGLDATAAHVGTLSQQRVFLQVHLGAAFRHERMAHLHGAHAWAELLDILQQRARNGTLERLARTRALPSQTRRNLFSWFEGTEASESAGTLRPNPYRQTFP